MDKDMYPTENGGGKPKSKKKVKKKKKKKSVAAAACDQLPKPVAPLSPSESPSKRPQRPQCCGIGGKLYTEEFCFGSRGCREGQFDGPTGIASLANGWVVVSDTGSHRLQVFDAGGAFLHQWGRKGSGEDGLRSPRGLSVERGVGSGGFTSQVEECVYVADSGNHRVVVLSASSGKLIRSIGCCGSSDGELLSPTDVAVSPSGKIVVADRGNSRIQIFDLKGRFLRKWGVKGHASQQFIFPSSVALCPASDDLFVCDTNNNRVQRFDLEGKPRGPQHCTSTTRSHAHVPAGEIFCPSAVAVSAAGTLVVAELGVKAHGFGCLHCFGPEGTSESVSRIWLKCPAEDSTCSVGGLCFTRGGRLLAADTWCHNVRVFPEFLNG